MAKKKRIVTIYGLRRPGTAEIRYVGQTRRTLSERLSRHLSKPHSKAMSDWLTELGSVGLKPEAIVLATVTNQSWVGPHRIERDWIASLSIIFGRTLLNEHHRGDFIGLYTFSGLVAKYKKRLHRERMMPVWEERRRDGNERRRRMNERRIFYKGKVVNLSQHAKSLGISRQRLDQRIKKCRELGVDVRQALTTPSGEPMPCCKKRMGVGRPKKNQAAVA